MTPAAVYQLADARARARHASAVMRAGTWTIGDPLAWWWVAIRDVRAARRALRAAGAPIPPSRPYRIRVRCCDLDTAPVVMDHADAGRPRPSRVASIWTPDTCPQHREATR